MYIDETITLPDNLPQTLRNLIEETETAYQRNDDSIFTLGLDNNMETIEALTKNAFVMHQISEADLDAVFRRYGWR